MSIKNFTLNPSSNLESLITKIRQLPKDDLYVANIAKKQSARSLDQNALYWKLCTEFGFSLGYEREEMHQTFGDMFLKYQKDGKEFIKSTTKLSTKEFAEYYEKCERVAAQQGFMLEGV